MIYKISLDDMIQAVQSGASFVLQNETHCLVQDNSLPPEIIIIETYQDTDLHALYSDPKWQQPHD